MSVQPPDVAQTPAASSTRKSRPVALGDRPATISDVAARAGVSRATVSRVVNGNTTVDRDIAARVEEAVAALGYRPSTLARGLSLGSTQTVGVVVPDLENPTFQSVLRGVTRAAASQGYRVLVADTEEKVEDEAELAVEARRRCDALVLCAPRMSDEKLLALLPELHPVVVVNREVDDPSIPVVAVDYASAAFELTQHLLDLGHRSFAYLRGPEGSSSDKQRRRGIGEAFAATVTDVSVLADFSSAALPTLIEIATGARIEDGHRVADRVLASDATAVIAFNDLVAFGLLTRLREEGISVPGEISVVGIDDIPVSQYAAPPLTTASVPQLEAGMEAWRRLSEAIGGAAAAAPILFRPSIVVRESTGPASPRASNTSRWRVASDGPAEVLSINAVAVARYGSGVELPERESPRPFLHPITTLDGIGLSETAPADHAHHHGLSFAVPDIDGTSYWGGRTFVRGRGSTELTNHGTQHRVAARVTAGVMTENLTWYDEHGAAHLDEVRRIEAAPVPDHPEAWLLSWRSEIHAAHRALRIGSPASNGRPGAGYGGLFWRIGEGIAETRRGDETLQATRILSADGEGEQNAHESSSPWLAISRRVGDREFGIVLSQPGVVLRPWFVRLEEYLGAGPMLAPAFALTIGEGARVTTALAAVVLDRAVDSRAEAESLAALARVALRVRGER